MRGWPYFWECKVPGARIWKAAASSPPFLTEGRKQSKWVSRWETNWIFKKYSSSDWRGYS